MTTVDPSAQQFHPTTEQPKDNGATPRSVDWNNPRVAAILDAAAKCFARKGFSATTLAEIGKELGLRKSIVHYYFASKAALIHEVQSYTYQKYLDRVKEAIASAGGTGDPAHVAMRALWAAVGEGDVGLNIEVWSASRNDEELRRRAQALQEEKRKVIEDGLRALLGPAGANNVPLRPLSTLVMSVLNGLAVSEYVEGHDAQVQKSYEMFLALLAAGGKQPSTLSSGTQAAAAPAPPSA